MSGLRTNWKTSMPRTGGNRDMVKSLPEVLKTLVHLKRKKAQSSAKIQKALVLKADLPCPYGSFTYLPLAGLPRMTAPRLIGLGPRDTCEIFGNRMQGLSAFR